jgi:hypothetical protein
MWLGDAITQQIANPSFSPKEEFHPQDKEVILAQQLNTTDQE